MESSTLVVLRTLVMLASLVAIPLAAVFGTSSWPQFAEMLQRFGVGEGKPAAVAGDAAFAGFEVAGPTPLSVSQGAMPTQAGLPLGNPAAPTTGMPSAEMALAAVSPAEVSAMLGPLPGAAQPLAMAGPSGVSGLPRAPAFWSQGGESNGSQSPAASGLQDQTATVHAHGMAGLEGARATPAAYVTPEPTGQAATAQIPNSPAAPFGAASDSAGVSGNSIEGRLQALGALHYRLETAGPSGQWFRFQCKMGVDDNPNYVRYFDATDVDPQRAMQRVLGDVEAWLSQAGARGAGE